MTLSEVHKSVDSHFLFSPPPFFPSSARPPPPAKASAVPPSVGIRPHLASTGGAGSSYSGGGPCTQAGPVVTKAKLNRWRIKSSLRAWPGSSSPSAPIESSFFISVLRFFFLESKQRPARAVREVGAMWRRSDGGYFLDGRGGGKGETTHDGAPVGWLGPAGQSRRRRKARWSRWWGRMAGGDRAALGQEGVRALGGWLAAGTAAAARGGGRDGGGGAGAKGSRRRGSVQRDGWLLPREEKKK